MERRPVQHARKIAFASALPLVCTAWGLLAVQYPLRNQDVWLIWAASIPAGVIAFIAGREWRAALLRKWVDDEAGPNS